MAANPTQWIWSCWNLSVVLELFQVQKQYWTASILLLTVIKLHSTLAWPTRTISVQVYCHYFTPIIGLFPVKGVTQGGKYHQMLAYDIHRYRIRYVHHWLPIVVGSVNVLYLVGGTITKWCHHHSLYAILQYTAVRNRRIVILLGSAIEA